MTSPSLPVNSGTGTQCASISIGGIGDLSRTFGGNPVYETGTSGIMNSQTPSSMSDQVRRILDRSVSILVQPYLYFSMDDEGLDFSEGARYVAIMGILASLLGLLVGGSVFTGGSGMGVLLTLAIAPVVAVIASFILAGLIHLVCSLSGTRADFGDSYGISAASAVLAPLSVFLNVIPVIGSVIGLIWGWWIVSEGGRAVHRLSKERARLLFGMMYGAFAVSGLFVG